MTALACPPLAVVIPVKRFVKAKRRLQHVLDTAARSAFAQAMYRDVLDAVTQAVPGADVFVVTADADAARIAVSHGCNVVAEREGEAVSGRGNRIAADGKCAGLIAALSHGMDEAAAAGYAAVLALPADLPLLRADDLRALAHAHAPSHPPTSGVTLVASLDGCGTNALCCATQIRIELCHGEDSFRRHLDAARAADLRAVVLALPRVAFDIDTAHDLAALLRRPSTTRSHAFLATLKLDMHVVARGIAAERVPVTNIGAFAMEATR